MLEAWLVWIETHCNCEIHTDYGRPSQKKQTEEGKEGGRKEERKEKERKKEGNKSSLINKYLNKSNIEINDHLFK